MSATTISIASSRASMLMRGTLRPHQTACLERIGQSLLALFPAVNLIREVFFSRRRSLLFCDGNTRRGRAEEVQKWLA
jgi:hypothetical protein